MELFICSDLGPQQFSAETLPQAYPAGRVQYRRKLFTKWPRSFNWLGNVYVENKSNEHH